MCREASQLPGRVTLQSVRTDEFDGARCGLSDKDRGWLDRYGIAWGARVREDPRDHWERRHSDVEWWVEVNDLEVRDGGETPAIRDYYSDWFLLDRDFPEDTDREDVDADLVEVVLEERRDYPVACDLSMTDVSNLRAERTTTLKDVETAKQDRVDDAMEEYDIPAVLEPWAFMAAEKRERMQSVLKAVRDYPVGSYSDIEMRSNASESSIQNYASDDDELGACMAKRGREYCLTPIGEAALETPWDKVAPK